MNKYLTVLALVIVAASGLQVRKQESENLVQL